MRLFPTLTNWSIVRLCGWLVFAIAALVYTQTVEPTASFWDCSEFIATAYKLQVPHPPGAPLFLLTYRLFSMLAFGDTTQVAYWMNIASALCSAFTILFLYWTITLLGRKLLVLSSNAFMEQGPFNPTPSQTMGLISAGAVGALAYTFSDSFWFSAVEAEVYAMSSLFTAFVVWAMLRWELIQDRNASLRWLLLIAYVVGLSIGVHLLNLVTVPALALLFYFKWVRERKKHPTLWGGLVTLAIGGSLIALIMTGIRTGLPTLAGEVEIVTVNNFGLPFGSGIAFFVTLFLGLLIYGIRYSILRQKIWLNTALLGFAFVLIGYSSYTIALIRSNHNPPINENQPDDVLSFVYYLNMKQYPTRPLVYGPYFTAPIIDQHKGEPLYMKGEKKYEIAAYDRSYVYDPKQTTLFPRLYSRDRNSPEVYRQLLGLPEGKKPTMLDNIRYMCSHQLGYMYGRYFMWNFAGRASDREGAGWLASLSSTAGLPSELANNWGRNNYFMLPLILGLLGVFFQYKRNRQGFVFTFLLFFMMGAALVLYLNTPPVEPRERDYIYVGSYYAFAIWLGLGVMALAAFFHHLIKNRMLGTLAAGLACLTVPGIMADQGWDDHDRSGRYVAVDTAKNMLNACAPNAILFTNGDNDTFPLWYAQEVEGFRTDVRVMISGYLNFDWYADQMKRKTYQSEPLPISLDFKNYAYGTNDQILFLENPAVKGGISLPQYLNLVKNDSPAIKVALQNGESIHTLPSNKLVLPLDKQAILKSGIINKDLEDLLKDTMELTLNKDDLLKDDLLFLDILATNNWKRPIYFASILNAAKYNLQEYTQIEGMVCRLLPVKVPGAKQGYVNSEVMYNNMMHKSVWKGLDDPAVYHDENSRRITVLPSRLQFFLLADQLLREEQKPKAREGLLRCLAVMPDASVPYDRINASLIGPLVEVGEEKKALGIATIMAKRADENLNYYANTNVVSDNQEIYDSLGVLKDIIVALKPTHPAEAQRYEALLNQHVARFNN